MSNQPILLGPPGSYKQTLEGTPDEPKTFLVWLRMYLLLWAAALLCAYLTVALLGPTWCGIAALLGGGLWMMREKVDQEEPGHAMMVFGLTVGVLMGWVLVVAPEVDLLWPAPFGFRLDTFLPWYLRLGVAPFAVGYIRLWAKSGAYRVRNEITDPQFPAVFKPREAHQGPVGPDVVIAPPAKETVAEAMESLLVVEHHFEERNRRQTRWDHLPVTPQQMTSVARLVLGVDGLPVTSFAEGAVSGKGRPISDKRFRKLRDVLIERGLACWVDPDVPTQGTEWVKSGVTFLMVAAGDGEGPIDSARCKASFVRSFGILSDDAAPGKRSEVLTDGVGGEV